MSQRVLARRYLMGKRVPITSTWTGVQYFARATGDTYPMEPSCTVNMVCRDRASCQMSGDQNRFPLQYETLLTGSLPCQACTSTSHEESVES